MTVSGTICAYFAKGKVLSSESVLNSLREANMLRPNTPHTEKLNSHIPSVLAAKQYRCNHFIFSNARVGSVSIIRRWVLYHYVCKCAADMTWLWNWMCDISTSSAQRSHTKHYRQVCSGHHWLEESYQISALLCNTHRLSAAKKKKILLQQLS